MLDAIYSHSVNFRRIVGALHGDREARAYNVGLGAELPARSKGRSPGQEGVRGRSPAEGGDFFVFQKCK